MSHKGIKFPYPLVSRTQADLGKEIDAVGNAYQNAGWKEVDVIPAEGFPTHIVFEWQQDRPPFYPSVSL